MEEYIKIALYASALLLTVYRFFARHNDKIITAVIVGICVYEIAGCFIPGIMLDLTGESATYERMISLWRSLKNLPMDILLITLLVRRKNWPSRRGVA